MWLTWTFLLCILMLSPSDGTVRDISLLFGGLEITDAVGHVILIGIECMLLYQVMVLYLSDRLAQKLAVVSTLIFGIILEVSQLWIPSRGASLIDIIAAFVGVGLAYMIIMRWSKLDGSRSENK